MKTKTKEMLQGFAIGMASGITFVAGQMFGKHPLASLLILITSIISLSFLFEAYSR